MPALFSPRKPHLRGELFLPPFPISSDCKSGSLHMPTRIIQLHKSGRRKEENKRRKTTGHAHSRACWPKPSQAAEPSTRSKESSTSSPQRRRCATARPSKNDMPLSSGIRRGRERRFGDSLGFCLTRTRSVRPCGGVPGRQHGMPFRDALALPPPHQKLAPWPNCGVHGSLEPLLPCK